MTRLAGALPHLAAHAVGEASASAAEAAGLEVVTVGENGVEGLLDRLPSDLRLLHLAGEERVLPPMPRQQITSVTVYRMATLPLPQASFLEGAVAVIHSPAAGRRLGEVTVARERVRVAISNSGYFFPFHKVTINLAPADVKKIDPTKKVMASAFAPTACTYAGIAPRAKQDAPSMKSQAIAEFRRAGSARMLTQRPQRAEFVLAGLDDSTGRLCRWS